MYKKRKVKTSFELDFREYWYKRYYERIFKELGGF